MKLFICGNGFDLHHGLKTSYQNYKNYLKDSHPDIVNEFEEFIGVYDNSRIGWTNIEDALKVDYLKMLYRYADLPSTSDEVYQFFHSGVSLFHGDNSLEQSFMGLTYFINNFTGRYLYDWLYSIDLNDAIPDLKLAPTDLYITFNYLDSLELLYNIPSERILHIHVALHNIIDLQRDSDEAKKEFIKSYQREIGKKEAIAAWEIEAKPTYENMIIREQLQFGAVINKENELQKLKHWYSADDEYSEYVNPSITVIEEFIDKSTKTLRNNYLKLLRFICCTKDIDTVTIMGHTLLGVDFPYYKEILIPYLGDKLWVFKAHNGNTTEILEFIREFRLENYRIENW